MGVKNIKTEDESENSEMIEMSRIICFEYSLIKYCGFDHFIDLWKIFLGKEKVYKDRCNLVKSEISLKGNIEYANSVSVKNSVLIMNVFLENNIIEMIRQLRESINLKISEWEDRIERKNNSIDDLLNV